MKTFALVAVFTLALSCAAQQIQTHPAIAALVQKVEVASDKADGRSYASIFGENATWNGPHGENALGRENIVRAADLMLRNSGSLKTREWNARTLAPDIILVDIYQIVQNSSANRSGHIRVASGSGLIPWGDFRTTLLFKRTNGIWEVVLAHVADLRVQGQRITHE
jgi:uncharacterized protein (TIGR02246 family)